MLKDSQRDRLRERTRLADRADAHRAAVSQSQPAISALVYDSSSDCMLHSGALKPMPPGYAS